MRNKILAILLLGCAGSLQAVQAGRPDLVVSNVGLNSQGAVMFTISNRGEAAVATPFKVDAWLDGYLRKTIQFGALRETPAVRVVMNTALPIARGEQRHLALGDVKVDLCSNNHNVKVIVDSGNAIAESNESNNELSWSGPTPCPDLAIKSIGKHWQNSMHTEFTAEIVVINQGTGDAGPFSVAAGAFTQSGLGVPSGAPLLYEGLRAGETLTIRAGNAYIPDGLSVHVVVDVGNVIKESNENNNVADKTLH